MNKFTISVIILILGAFGGLIAWQTMTTKKPTEKADLSSINAGAIIEGSDLNGGIADHVRGNAESKVVVVEYADFQCPGCASMVSHVNKIYKKYNKDVAFVFRNFPLSMHQNARAAAAAAEAAGMQGYYWEMNEALYTNRSSWTDQAGDARTNAFMELFAGIADTEVDLDKFRADLGDENILKKIDFDYDLGKEVSHVAATPALYVNGKAVDVANVQTFDEVENLLINMIDEALEEAQSEK